MPVYLYRCKVCRVHGEKWQAFNDDPLLVCPECGGRVNRVMSFTPAKVMHEHFDHTTGKIVSDRKQWLSELQRKSDEASERSGRDTNYVPVDLDPESLSVTEEGMDSTLRRKTKTGQREVKQWL